MHPRLTRKHFERLSIYILLLLAPIQDVLVMKTKKAAAQEEEHMTFGKSKLEWGHERVAKELEMRKDELKDARLEWVAKEQEMRKDELKDGRLERVAKELEMRKDELRDARLEREASQKAEDEERKLRVERERYEREDRREERWQRQEAHMAMMQMLQSSCRKITIGIKT